MSAKKKDPNKIKLDKHIGIKLRNKRVERKLNQTKVADVLNCTFQQIQKFEKGSNGLSAFYLGKLAKFFKVPVSYFFDGFSYETFESSITYYDRFPEIHRGNQVKNENLYPNPNTYTPLGNKMKDVFLIEETIKKEDIF